MLFFHLLRWFKKYLVLCTLLRSPDKLITPRKAESNSGDDKCEQLWKLDSKHSYPFFKTYAKVDHKILQTGKNYAGSSRLSCFLFRRNDTHYLELNLCPTDNGHMLGALLSGTEHTICKNKLGELKLMHFLTLCFQQAFITS